MGGLVIKDLLVTAQHQSDDRLRRISTAAAGAVFYSVPHAGSRLADWGWILRYGGGSPAKHVRQLKRGPHPEVSERASEQAHVAAVGWAGLAAVLCRSRRAAAFYALVCFLPTDPPTHPPHSTHLPALPYPNAPAGAERRGARPQQGWPPACAELQ